MSQAQPNKNGPSLGVAAAAAATGASAKPADHKPTDAKPEDKGTGNSTEPDKKKRESKRKVYVVMGTVTEFESIVQAEKYLNGPEAPAPGYKVIQGTMTRQNTKVSLR